MAELTNHACTLLKPQSVEIREISLPELGPEDVLVQVECTGICGSDVCCPVPLSQSTILTLLYI
jgi:D-arabinose 1-dehydrogenase-like Zn-dependent alcohol dehydrogenase